MVGSLLLLLTWLGAWNLFRSKRPSIGIFFLNICACYPKSLTFISTLLKKRRNLGGAQTSLVNLASLCDCDYDAKMEMETRTGSLHLLADSLPDAFEKLCQIVDRAREPGAQLHVHNVYALEKFADIQMVRGV